MITNSLGETPISLKKFKNLLKKKHMKLINLSVVLIFSLVLIFGYK